MKVLEQLAHAAHELVIGLGDDTGVVADTVRLMLLEQHVPRHIMRTLPLRSE